MKPSPSAMMPRGARCTPPSAPTVVTMVSRIIGIWLTDDREAVAPTSPFEEEVQSACGQVFRSLQTNSALRLRSAQRVSGFAQPGQILRLAVDRAAPIERLVLCVAFSQPPRDLGLRQFRAGIEGMRGVGGDSAPWGERERLPGAVVPIGVVAV